MNGSASAIRAVDLLSPVPLQHLLPPLDRVLAQRSQGLLVGLLVSGLEDCNRSKRLGLVGRKLGQLARRDFGRGLPGISCAVT
jgi:hypothetical protein